MNKFFGYHGLNIIENHPQVSLVLDVSTLNSSFQAKVVKSKNIQCFFLMLQVLVPLLRYHRVLWLNPEAVLPTRSHRTFGDKIVKKSSAARSCLQKVSRQIAHGILLPLLPLMKARYGIKGAAMAASRLHRRLGRNRDIYR